MKKGVDWSERNYLIKEGGLAWLWVLNLLPAFDARKRKGNVHLKWRLIQENLDAFKKKPKT